jgi:hypothetical protein
MFTYFIGMYAAYLLLLIVSSIYVSKKMSKRGRGSVIDKNTLLSNCKSPKIILLGGSNVCYGINSKLLQDSLNMPVIDMAINATTGMLFYYNQIKEFIQNGDIVIGIPEYAAYTRNQLYGDVNVYELIVVQYSNIRFLNFWQWVRLPRFAGDILKENYKTIVSDGNSDVSNGRKKYNAFGDYIGHQNDTSNIMNRHSFIPTFSNGKDFQIDPEFAKMIVEFDGYCKQRGATYLHSYPVFLRNTYKSNWQTLIESNLNGIRFLNKPDEYLFSADSLYDSENHIQFRYRNLRTVRLLNDIKNIVESKNNK